MSNHVSVFTAMPSKCQKLKSQLLDKYGDSDNVPLSKVDQIACTNTPIALVGTYDVYFITSGHEQAISAHMLDDSSAKEDASNVLDDFSTKDDASNIVAFQYEHNLHTRSVQSLVEWLEDIHPCSQSFMTEILLKCQTYSLHGHIARHVEGFRRCCKEPK